MSPLGPMVLEVGPDWFGAKCLVSLTSVKIPVDR